MMPVIQRPATRALPSALLFILVCGLRTAAAQPPASTPAPGGEPTPPLPVWTGNAGFGLSLSRGNTSTMNLNVSGEATRGAKTASVWKFKGLYLRGNNNGTLAVDRLSFDARNERTLDERVYAFVDLQFLEDQFKQIDYLWAPSVGIGYKLIADAATTLNVDVGVGVKVEQDEVLVSNGTVTTETAARRTDAILTASDKFEHKISPTATITEGFGALWKATDFGDALYTLSAGLAAAITGKTQLKFELLDTYQARPPAPTVKSNDLALITALVYKF